MLMLTAFNHPWTLTQPRQLNSNNNHTNNRMVAKSLLMMSLTMPKMAMHTPRRFIPTLRMGNRLCDPESLPPHPCTARSTKVQSTTTWGSRLHSAP